MPTPAVPLRAAVVIDRSPARIAHALGRFDVFARTAHVFDHRLTGSRPDLRVGAEPAAQLRDGDRLRLQQGSRAVQFQVARETPTALPTLAVVATANLPSWPAQAQIRFDLAETGAGTIVTAEFLGREWLPAMLAFHRGRVLKVLRHLLGIVTLAVHEDQVVVAAAIVRDGRVLAARRTRPSAEAGKWELPGGKAEPGESDERALVREIAEELGTNIRVLAPLGPHVPLGVELVLHTYAAELISGDPEPAEHDRIAWLDASSLGSVDWLPADVELLPALTALLTATDGQRPQM